jgi:hypothetical protein
MAAIQNVKPAISHLQTPPLPLALASPSARLPIAPFFHPSCACTSAFSAIGRGTPNAETGRTTSYTKPLHPAPSYTTPPPPLSSETVLPIPPPPSSALAPASISLAPLPDLYLYTPRLIPLYPPLRTCATLTPSFTRFNRSPCRNIHSAYHLLAIRASNSRL